MVIFYFIEFVGLNRFLAQNHKQVMYAEVFKPTAKVHLYSHHIFRKYRNAVIPWYAICMPFDFRIKIQDTHVKLIKILGK